MRRRRSLLSDISKSKAISPFEKAVYKAVLGIPRGQVRSYKWVAKAALKSGACRAVGNALNRNPYAPDVPCHRVIRSDGAIGGFAYGSGLKEKLLKKEGVDCRNGRCYNVATYGVRHDR